MIDEFSTLPYAASEREYLAWNLYYAVRPSQGTLFQAELMCPSSHNSDDFQAGIADPGDFFHPFSLANTGFADIKQQTINAVD